MNGFFEIRPANRPCKMWFWHISSWFCGDPRDGSKVDGQDTQEARVFKAIAAAAGIEGCAHGNELHNLFVYVHVWFTRDWRGFVIRPKCRQPIYPGSNHTCLAEESNIFVKAHMFNYCTLPKANSSQLNKWCVWETTVLLGARPIFRGFCC